MTDQAPENATTRIERAIARIAACAQREAPADDSLERRHARLRAEVASAIAALDSLIDGEDG